jgi:cyanate lyase
MKDSVFADPMMDKDDVAAMVLAAKKRLGLSWAEIAEKTGLSPVFTHSAAMGMNSMPEGRR